MDASELDDRFAQEQERLEEEFADALKTDPEKAKARFETRYRKLIADYQERERKLIEHEEWLRSIERPMVRMRHQASAWLALPGAWTRKRKAALRKWLFDRRIRRLLRS